MQHTQSAIRVPTTDSPFVQRLKTTDPAEAARLLRSTNAEACFRDLDPSETMGFPKLRAALESGADFRRASRLAPPGAVVMEIDTALETAGYVNNTDTDFERDIFLDFLFKHAKDLTTLTRSSEVSLIVTNRHVPGDLYWHEDTMPKARGGLRLLISFGRKEGMHICPKDNLDFAAFRKEAPKYQHLLRNIDREYSECENPQAYEILYARSRALIARLTQLIEPPFIKDQTAIIKLPGDCVSIHQIAGIEESGTVHRASYKNREGAGFTVIMTSPYPDY